MPVTFKPFNAAEFLDSDQVRLSYLNAVLADGDMAELKDALEIIAESKGIKGIDLSAFEGDTLEFMQVLKKLGFGLQALRLSKSHTA
ncbi:helix-turn-helix domain-containing transcriptional regulator [Helicobacter bizzozeronii]|uniref:Addiction module antidote protein n=1 Tax=Helicobacter bizzozeronii (strain CIII-1) TaxID=1002804 RepID=F8KQH4_HELBC|nr:hypothetical protein [Helicobacter bizzozeronii]CCB80790.1 hypothetical protein HBZC1_18040 [Helicobacter bizzozeronii CIII-1]